MRENTRSRGRWTPQQENRRRKLRNLCYEESISDSAITQLRRLNKLHERYIKLQHPLETRRSKEGMEALIKAFVVWKGAFTS
jgi:hypothetical protein